MMKQTYEHIRHEFAPVYDENSGILILGTFPSVKSREQNFYYGHPRNRFWKVLAALYGEKLPVSTEEKKKFLLRNHVAVWDVIAQCDIIGSSDSSIKNVIPADLRRILDYAPVRRIYANGTKAYDLYMKYSYESTGMEITRLPSTSPANAAYQMERLLDSWKVILQQEGI